MQKAGGAVSHASAAWQPTHGPTVTALALVAADDSLTQLYREGERHNIDEHAVPAVGAYLGEVLVRHLGGQWLPRKKLVEAQVRVGNRVWLPFLRAHRYMGSCQSLLDFSLTQLFRVAQRHRS